PHPLFNTGWYLDQNPEVGKRGLNPLIHFLEVGLAKGLDPNPSFANDWTSPPPEPPNSNFFHLSGKTIHNDASPSVSVIVPVFNKAPFIRECAESILAQSLHDLEVIFIDDGSQDESPELLENIAKLDCRVRVITNPSNIGAGAARNIGIEVAAGDYVQFTDADDILPIYALERLY